MGCKLERCHLRHWATDVSDIHGLKHIAGAGGIFRRLFWLCVFFTSLGFCLYQCVLVVRGFAAYSHVTKVDVEFQNKVPFPAVTVCNFNKYRESAMTADDLKHVGIHLGIINEDHELIYPELYTEEFQDFVDGINWSGVVEDEDYNMTEFLTRTGHQQEDMIVSCTWHDETCEDDDFILQLTHLGNCYSFNTHSEAEGDDAWKFSLNAGTANGLQLILDLETPEYTPSNDLDAGAIDAGLRVMMHYPTEPPYPKELGFSVAPGKHTFVSMKHTTVTSLPPPYANCQEDGADIITHFSHFSIQACRIECEAKIVVGECGCRLAEQPGDDEVCNPKETHDCAHPTLVHFMAGTLETDEECECLSPCYVESYPFTSSQAALRTTFLEMLYSNSSRNMSADYIRDNIAVLTIYYEALNSESITMVPEYTIATLLAVLGGNMGLFLGASFLTIVQLGEYFVDEIIGWCVCVKERRPHTTNTQGGSTKVDPTQTIVSKDAWATGNI